MTEHTSEAVQVQSHQLWYSRVRSPDDLSEITRRAGRLELRYQRIAKAAFDRFVAETIAAVWPWEEMLGARPIGQWRVIYPAAPSRTRESADESPQNLRMRQARLLKRPKHLEEA